MTAYEKSTVEFVVELSRDVDKVQWFLDDEELFDDDRVQIVPDGCTHKLIISNINLEDAGQIKAQVGDKFTAAVLTVQELAADFTATLPDVTAMEKKTAEFVCELTKPVDKARWFLDDIELLPSKQVEIISDGKIQKLIVKDLVPEDAGIIKIQVGEKYITANLIVEELPAEFTLDLKDVTAMEKTTAELVCHLSKPVEKVSWFIDDTEIKPQAKVSFSDEGLVHKVIIKDLALTDAGKIIAKVGNKTTSAKLTVTELPLEFVTPLSDVTVMEKSTAVFECELSKDVEKARWFLDNVELRQSPLIKFVKDGKKHQLIMDNVAVEDEGQISVTFEEKSSAADLFVQGNIS